MQTLCNYSVKDLRVVLAYLNSQPYSPAVDAKRALVVNALAHRDCPICQGEGRIGNDIPCTSSGAL